MSDQSNGHDQEQCCHQRALQRMRMAGITRPTPTYLISTGLPPIRDLSTEILPVVPEEG